MPSLAKVVMRYVACSAAVLFLFSATAVFADSPTRDLAVTPKSAAESVPISGQYWALIIGIDRYQYGPRLQSAVKDATAVRDVLIQRYGFAKERIFQLLDENATRVNIEGALFTLAQQTAKEDSVFIYFAGHGQYEEDGKLAWWIPVEANPTKPGTFIPDVSVLNYIRGMKAKHVYLVADSCFSGTMFGTRALPPIENQWISKLYAKPSRWALTSGGNEPVTDQGKNGHSIFAYHFIMLLKDNEEPYLIPLRIYDRLAPLVANNANQTPRSEPLRNAGDEGGQFVFRLTPPDIAAKAIVDERRRVQEELQHLQSETAAIENRRREAQAKVNLAAQQRQLEEDLRLLAQEKARKEEEQRKLLEMQLPPDLSELLKKIPLSPPAEQESKPLEEARARPYEAPQQTGKEITGKDGAPMVLVPAGEFLYGGKEAEPLAEFITGKFEKERKSLPAFYMDKYEVSTKLYAKFLQATGKQKPAYWHDVRLVSDGERPVIGVTWHEADAYCRQYGKRLPTEQEWEKAARGTDGRTYPWGNEEPNRSLANYAWDGKTRSWQGYSILALVGSYEAGKSPYGIYNMAGNVWEWTSSDYDIMQKVLRGGSWSNGAYSLASAFRAIQLPTSGTYNLGFRCLKDAR